MSSQLNVDVVAPRRGNIDGTHGVGVGDVVIDLTDVSVCPLDTVSYLTGASNENYDSVTRHFDEIKKIFDDIIARNGFSLGEDTYNFRNSRKFLIQKITNAHVSFNTLIKEMRRVGSQGVEAAVIQKLKICEINDKLSIMMIRVKDLEYKSLKSFTNYKICLLTLAFAVFSIIILLDCHYTQSTE